MDKASIKKIIFDNGELRWVDDPETSAKIDEVAQFIVDRKVFVGREDIRQTDYVINRTYLDIPSKK